MTAKRGSKAAIAEIVKIGKKISIDDMVGIAEKAEAAGGSLVSVATSDIDDDWCGNGVIRFPWPPKKKDDFFNVLDLLVAKRLNMEILINGIAPPEEILVQISRQYGR
jgi:hypothetical protein